MARFAITVLICSVIVFSVISGLSSSGRVENKAGNAPAVIGGKKSPDAWTRRKPKPPARHFYFGVCWYVEGTPGGPLFSNWNTSANYYGIEEDRYWCADRKGGLQQTRTSYVHPDGSCNWSNAYQQLVSGGNGHTWATVKTGAKFTCHEPSGTFYHTAWQKWSCNTWGNCSLVARDGG